VRVLGVQRTQHARLVLGGHHAVCVDNNGYPVVRCSKDGPDEDDVRAVKAFLAAEEAAEKELGIHKEITP